MIRNGTGPSRMSHRDWDLLKTKHSHILAGVVAYPIFPPSYNTDNGLFVPNQEVEDTEFTPPVPAMPNGCTCEAQADNATDLNGKSHSPAVLEALTHANTNGGYDIRSSMEWCLPATPTNPNRLGWYQNFFNIVAHAPLDYFDAMRLAQFSGVPEKRSVSWGCPWFPSWERACQAGEFLMPPPTAAEILQAQQNPDSLPWHNSSIKGWESYNGVLVLINKSWQGKEIGTGGFVGFDRATINTVMSLVGTIALIPTNESPTSVVTVSVTAWQYVQSVMNDILTLIGFSY